MAERWVTKSELWDVLLRGGHCLKAADPEDPARFDVSPPPDLVVTVALNLDPTQKSEYRDRYFATLVDDDHFPILQHEPDFALTESFAEAAEGERHSYGAFMAGPFRWLLRRLGRAPHWLLWPEVQIRNVATFVRESWVLDDMPHLREWLRREPPVPPDAGALVLDLSSGTDCQVLWEVAEQVETGFYNYYLGDPEGAEVYRLHHHSKVFVSIPDEEGRLRLLEDLSAYPDLFEDCSGYESDYDDDEEPGEVDPAT